MLGRNSWVGVVLILVRPGVDLPEQWVSYALHCCPWSYQIRSNSISHSLIWNLVARYQIFFFWGGEIKWDYFYMYPVCVFIELWYGMKYIQLAGIIYNEQDLCRSFIYIIKKMNNIDLHNHNDQNLQWINLIFSLQWTLYYWSFDDQLNKPSRV